MHRSRAAPTSGRPLRRRRLLRPGGEADPDRERAGRVARAGCRPGSGGACSTWATSTRRAIVLVPLVPPGLLDGVDPAARRPRPSADGGRAVQGDRGPLRRVDAVALPRGARGRRSSIRSSTPTRRSNALWGDVAHVCRMDEPDPGAAWYERIEQIWQVASRIDALGLDCLHFEGPGTDLTVGLLPSSRFAREGGSSHTRTGIRHIPNLPTEEVYTTPDPERTEGFVTATKPLDVFGSLVTGLRVRFEGGRAVEIDADTNVDALRGQLLRRPGRRPPGRGRARRPREPDRQARPHVLHHAARRERGLPHRARRRVCEPDRRPGRPAADQRRARSTSTS